MDANIRKRDDDKTNNSNIFFPRLLKKVSVTSKNDIFIITFQKSIHMNL